MYDVPKAAKAFEDNKDKMVANMTEEVMFEIFELVRQKLSKNNVPSPNASVDIKHEVFYGSGVIPQWAGKRDRASPTHPGKLNNH